VSQPYQQAPPLKDHRVVPNNGDLPAPAAAQMKRRNPIGVWLGLPIVTLGVYPIVWYYLVHSELARFNRRRPISAGMALCSVLFGAITLGIWPLVTWVKLCGHIRSAQEAAGLRPSCSGGMGFLMAILGFGMLYYQLELNKVVKQYADAPTGSPVPLAQ
jgi:hypothetical protein